MLCVRALITCIWTSWMATLPLQLRFRNLLSNLSSSLGTQAFCDTVMQVGKVPAISFGPKVIANLRRHHPKAQIRRGFLSKG